MNIIPSKLSSSQTTIFSEMSSLAAQYGALNLGQGFPDYDPPVELLQLVKKNIDDHRHQYAPMTGVLPLREAISQKIRGCYNQFICPDKEVTITAGSRKPFLQQLPPLSMQEMRSSYLNLLMILIVLP